MTPRRARMGRLTVERSGGPSESDSDRVPVPVPVLLLSLSDDKKQKNSLPVHSEALDG